MLPTNSSHLLRNTLILWLIKGSVDISVIGVPAQHADSAVRATRMSDYWHNDADKHDLPVKEREVIDIVDCDE